MRVKSNAVADALLLSITCPAAVLGLSLAAPAFATDHVVTASGMTFTPSTLTIAAGDTVTFRNAGGFHNAVSDPGSVTMFRCANGCDGAGGNGGISPAAWSATVTFPSAGTINFFCQEHGGAGGLGMSGRITVTAPVTPVAHRSDFNGDGGSDLLWRNSVSGGNVIWRSANSATQQATNTVAVSWQAVGVGDYNGDDHSDILWRNTSGANVIWRSGSAAKCCGNH